MSDDNPKEPDLSGLMGDVPSGNQKTQEPQREERPDRTNRESRGESREGRTLLPSSPANEDKRKPGYYVRRGADKRLSRMVHEVALELDIDISKSELAEAAIDLLVQEWNQNGREGYAAQWVRDRAKRF